MEGLCTSPAIADLKRKRKQFEKHVLVFSTKLDQTIETHRKLQEEIFKTPYKDWRQS